MLNVNGCNHHGSSASRHQRNENPTGGKRDWFAALNDTLAVTTIGAKMNR
jgi:hypothetical protein